MLTNDKRLRRWVRGATLALVAGTAVALAGCSDLMEVNNPGAIDTPDINDVYYLDHLVNGVIGQFHPLHGNTALYSAIFTDELANHHGYGEEIDIDHRNVADGNGTMAIMTYNRMHRTRWQADTAVQYIRNLLGADAAAKDLRVAIARAYGAHAIVLLGEQFCESPIDMSAPKTSEEILAMALPRFDEAIQVGLAAKAADPANAARADEIVNFARVGAARAALDLGDFQKAIAYAREVVPAYVSPDDEGFVFYSDFLEGYSTNPFYSRTAGDGVTISYYGTPLDSIFDDPRVPVLEDSVYGGGVRYVPLAPSAFLEHNGTLPGAPFQITTKIRSASALEARYIIAEAEGLNPANLAFVNERRAIGNQAPLPPTATEQQYVDALREQRMRDLLLDGHRMGDLRRYEKLYGDDLWQKGTIPGSTTGAQFGSQKCWPVPQAEKLGNPNYKN